MLDLNYYFSAEAVDWMVFYVVRQESLSQALFEFGVKYMVPCKRS